MNPVAFPPCIELDNLNIKDEKWAAPRLALDIGTLIRYSDMLGVKLPLFEIPNTEVTCVCYNESGILENNYYFTFQTLKTFKQRHYRLRIYLPYRTNAQYSINLCYEDVRYLHQRCLPASNEFLKTKKGSTKLCLHLRAASYNLKHWRLFSLFCLGLQHGSGISERQTRRYPFIQFFWQYCWSLHYWHPYRRFIFWLKLSACGRTKWSLRNQSPLISSGG